QEVNYVREGESGEKQPANVLKTFRFVKEAYIIPPGFEKNHKYGPISGISYEMR
ncbi:unnamed protein product, partial [Choristocarpus tenellus]